MPARLQKELDRLKKQILFLGAMVEENVDMAIKAVDKRDAALAEEAIMADLKVDELEVDFIAMEQQQITYYQVAASVRDEKTLKRELAPLQKINDHYPKAILTLDEDPQADYNGIRRINALDWLMGS